MARITIELDAPDAAVPVVLRAIAYQMNMDVPTTAAGKKSMIESYVKRDLKAQVQGLKQRDAQRNADNDDSDGALSW